MLIEKEQAILTNIIALKNKNPSYELESRITQNISIDQFKRLAKSLSKSGYIRKDDEQVLDINFYENSRRDLMLPIRYSINGITNIQNYCRTEKPGEKFIILFKDRVYGPSNELVFLNVSDLNFRINLKIEEMPSDTNEFSSQPARTAYDNLKRLFQKNGYENVSKTFRFKKRVSFITGDGNYRIDLTMIKTSKKEVGRSDRRTDMMMLTKSFKESNVLNESEMYEVEIEYIGTGQIGDDGDGIVKHTELVLNKLFSKTNRSISNSLQDQVRESYCRLMKQIMIQSVERQLFEIEQYANGNRIPLPSKDQPTVITTLDGAISPRFNIQNNFEALIEGITPSNFKKNKLYVDIQRKHRDLESLNCESNDKIFVPKVVSIIMSNLNEISFKTPNILHGRMAYTVTDKADGETMVLFCMNTPEPKVYLIDSNLNVFPVVAAGKITNWEKIKGSVLVGEFINKRKLADQTVNDVELDIPYLFCFDLYVFQNQDARMMPLVSENHGQSSRIGLANQIADWFSSATELNVNIRVKKFLSGNMLSQTKLIWDGKDKFPYDLDGVIYTPADAPVGFNPSDIGWSSKMATRWIYNLKWKPAEDNSIDFLVRIESEQIEVDKGKQIFLTRDKIRYKTVQNGEIFEIKPYKTLHLYCGLRGGVNPCIKSDARQSNYGPTKFTPTNPSSPNAYIAHIFLDKSNNIVGEKDSCRILDQTIVEFGFDIQKYQLAATDDDRAELWHPLRTRTDRTESYKKGLTFGNDFDVANSIWTSMHYPITETMITTGRGIPTITETQYYNRDSTVGRDKSLTIHLQVFHNAHIKDIHQYKKAQEYLMAKGQITDYHLLEMACGKGGDMFKWNKYNLSNVVAIDLNYNNIFDPKDGACKRYSDFVMKNKDIFGKIKLNNVSFLYGDISENIRDGEAVKPPTLELQQDLWNKLYNRRQFDIISIQFALHYLFETESKLDGFLRNVSENLRPGGIFMGTCFDGSVIYKKLLDLKKGKSIEGEQDGKIIFKIKKRYENIGPVLPADASSIGLPIEVYVASINQSITEFLVSYEYLVEKLGKLNIVPLETDLFENVFSRIQPEEQTLLEIEKTLSFLNRYFLFRKLENDEQKITAMISFIEQNKAVDPLKTVLKNRDWTALRTVLRDMQKELTTDEFQILTGKLSAVAVAPTAVAVADKGKVKGKEQKSTTAKKDCKSLTPEECKQYPEECVLGSTGRCSQKRIRKPGAAAEGVLSSELDLSPYLSNEGNTISIPKDVFAEGMDTELLIQAVVNSSIDYPLLRYFVKNPQGLFRNVVQYQPLISETLEMPKYRWSDSAIKRDNYRGKPCVFVQKPDDYNNVDRLTDLFTEYARIQAKRHDKPQSPEEYFQTHRVDLVRECLAQTGRIDSFEMRELLWKKGLEATNFKVSLAVSVYKYFKATRILDISAGWGDRLIAAIGHQAQRYLAYDPNKKLMAGHSAILTEFKADREQFSVRYAPFQDADLGQEMFDLIFTSPPYFDLEVYDTNAETAAQQSITQFRQFDQWMVSFLFRSLKKAWDNLMVGGNMVIHITDYAKNRIVEPMVLFVLSNCPGARFDGVMGTQGASGKIFPMWAFYKEERENKAVASSMAASLQRLYPSVYQEYATVFGVVMVPKDAAAVGLVKQIMDTGFPFVETFWSREEVRSVFEGIKKKMVDIPLQSLEMDGFINYTEYDLKREKNELAKFVKERKPDIRFKGRFISIESKIPELLDDDYLLVDYFTEPAKIKVRLSATDPSLEDHFYRGTLVPNAVSILKKNINPRSLHDLIVNQVGKMKSSEIDGVETRVYISSAENVFVYIILIRLLFPDVSLNSLNILDGAAGFGSRLMAAIMMNANYTGVEPNPLVVPGLNKMIAMLGATSKQRMIQDGLPGAPEFLAIPDRWSDVIFFSPPMWGMEIYNDEDKNQSINMFRDEQTWLTQFLYKSVEELWKRLKVGGFIVFQSVRYDYIGNYMMTHHAVDAQFKGIISRVTSSNRHKPNWIWQKIN